MVKRVSFCGLLLALSALAAVLVFGQATTNIIPPMGTGPTAPSTCTAPALFFQTPAGTPMYCSAGVFVSFGSSTGAAITGSPVSGNLAVFSASNSITNGNMSGDCTTAGGSVITCTKTSGTSFAPSATTDTTNATNITAGNLPLARLPAGLNTPVSGGLLSATGASTFAWTAAIGSGLPIIGQGAGAVPIAGARTGNTTTFATASGALTAGNVPKFDSSGNLIDSGTLPGTSATATLVNVTNDSQGLSTAIGGTVTLTQGSANASTQNQFPASSVGTIFQYNSGTAPNFRAVITAVGTNTITFNTIFPAPNATPNFNAALGTNQWNDIADPCAQIAASIANHQGGRLDASAVAPAGGATCTISPFVAPSVFSPGGSLAIFGKWTTRRSWYVPSGQWKLFGQVSWSGSNAATANNWTNALVVADNSGCSGASCFMQQYEANNLVASGTVTTSSTTFTDSGATGACTSNSAECAFNQVVSQTSPSGTCPTGLTGPGYCYFQMNNAMNGFFEGQNITFQAFSPGSGTWNGGFMLTGVSGTWGAFYCGLAGGCQTGGNEFPSGTVNTQNAATGGCSANCVTYVSGTNFNSNWTGATITINAVNYTISSVQSSTVLTLGSAPNTQSGVAYNVISVASMIPADTIQGYSVVSASNAGITYSTSTNNIPPSGIGTAEKQITVTGATPFTASDPGSCILTCTQGTGTGCGTSTSVTVAREVSTSVIAITGSSSPTWTSVQGTYQCYFQSPIVSVTNGTTLSTQVPMQRTLSNATANYSIATPVVSVQQLGSSGGTFPDGVIIESLGIECPHDNTNPLAAGVGLEFYGQELSHWQMIHTQWCTADGIQDFAGHESTSGQFDADMYANGTYPATSHGLAFYGTAGGSHFQANQGTILGNNNGMVPFASVVAYGAYILNLGDIHCEQAVRCVDLGPTGLGGGSRFQTNTIEPGIGTYEGVHIRNGSSASGALINTWSTNTPANALIVDDNISPTCGSGTSYVNGSTTGQGVGLYALGNGNGSSKTRFVTDGAPTTATYTAVQQCFFGGGIQAAAINTTANCNGGGVGGSATPTCNGLTGIITVPASTTSVTVTDTATTAGSILISQMGSAQAKYGLTPTACSTTAANPVIGAQTAGTSWVFTLTSVAAETCFVFQFVN